MKLAIYLDGISIESVHIVLKIATQLGLRPLAIHVNHKDANFLQEDPTVLTPLITAVTKQGGFASTGVIGTIFGVPIIKEDVERAYLECETDELDSEYTQTLQEEAWQITI